MCPHWPPLTLEARTWPERLQRTKALQASDGKGFKSFEKPFHAELALFQVPFLVRNVTSSDKQYGVAAQSLPDAPAPVALVLRRSNHRFKASRL